jgi:PAS domain-containing protein
VTAPLRRMCLVYSLAPLSECEREIMDRGPPEPAQRGNAAAASDFLLGGGEMGALMRAHDWSLSSLGSPGGWPQPLRTVVRLMLNTGHPMYVWWGPELACLYNDAYRESIGPERHPGSLGRPAREVWNEIWDIIGPQIDQVMSGRGATWHVDRLVPITRHGRLDEVYWTYSYSPIDDETAPRGIGGVLVVCSETTRQVLAARQLAAERDRLTQLFEQAPTFMALLHGPSHSIELANPGYMQLVGRHRPIIGKTVAEALPEAVAQGHVDLLDRVFESGQAMWRAARSTSSSSCQAGRSPSASSTSSINRSRTTRAA